MTSAIYCHVASSAPWLIADFVLGIVFDPEDGGIMFHQNNGGLLPDYMALHSRRYSKIN
jgi:hypothetical protein